MAAQSQHLHVIHIFQAPPVSTKRTTKKVRPAWDLPRRKWQLIDRVVLTDRELASSNLRHFIDPFTAEGRLLGKKKRRPPPSLYAHHYAAYEWEGSHYRLVHENYDHKGSIKTAQHVDRHGNPVSVGRTRSVPQALFPWSPPQHRAKKRAEKTVKKPIILPVRTPCRAGFADRLPTHFSPTVEDRVPSNAINSAIQRFRNCDWGRSHPAHWQSNDEYTHKLHTLQHGEGIAGIYDSTLRGRDKDLVITIAPSLGFGVWAVLGREIWNH